MRVEVRKAFTWYPDGIHPCVVPVGETVEGELAQHALAWGDGRELDASPAQTVVVEAAPMRAASEKAPRRK